MHREAIAGIEAMQRLADAHLDRAFRARRPADRHAVRESRCRRRRACRGQHDLDELDRRRKTRRDRFRLRYRVSGSRHSGRSFRRATGAASLCGCGANKEASVTPRLAESLSSTLAVGLLSACSMSEIMERLTPERRDNSSSVSSCRARSSFSREAIQPSISATLCSIIREISSSLLEIKQTFRDGLPIPHFSLRLWSSSSRHAARQSLIAPLLRSRGRRAYSRRSAEPGERTWRHPAGPRCGRAENRESKRHHSRGRRAGQGLARQASVEG